VLTMFSNLLRYTVDAHGVFVKYAHPTWTK